MFTVTVNDVLQAAATARDNETLAAFHPDFQKLGARQYECAYRYRGYPGVACAVGSGFSDAQARTLTSSQNGETVQQLIDAGKLKVTGGRSRTLMSLQARHDNILNKRSWGNQKLVDAAVKSFNEYLDKHLAKIPAAA